ncbi:flagellar operon protein [Alkaliphilus metalliredigens QYMF]|uniref:Flagellar operon protein n=1 Tax=Alkaliphilus metalliredigens (strain QYMF) TaxID=293826 RepID=A6TRQ1_ALKMQ|nr:TIGR02530 family flagellar biosynthesis protein [Alkaliphilus metalliredigens]ABR48869.1 flagellar operon protein [Alkaliphilus metalliredigens QYMF]
MINSIKTNHHMIQKLYDTKEKATTIKSVQDKFAFQQILQNKIGEQQKVKFSKHALDRLEQRNIKLTLQEIDKIDKAINSAANKGLKETLILMDNRAFIASVQNKTIITAADGDQLKGNVFTNIDGAVII